MCLCQFKAPDDQTRLRPLINPNTNTLRLRQTQSGRTREPQLNPPRSELDGVTLGIIDQHNISPSRAVYSHILPPVQDALSVPALTRTHHLHAEQRHNVIVERDPIRLR